MSEARKRPPITDALHVHQRGPSGNIRHVSPYRLVVSDRKRYFEIPAGSGEWFYEDKSPVAAADVPKKLGVILRKKSAQELQSEQNAEIAKLRAENEALKKQNEPAASGKVV